MPQQLYVIGKGVGRSGDWLIRRLIKVGARGSYHAKWHFHVACHPAGAPLPDCGRHWVTQATSDIELGEVYRTKRRKLLIHGIGECRNCLRGIFPHNLCLSQRETPPAER